MVVLIIGERDREGFLIVEFAGRRKGVRIRVVIALQDGVLQDFAAFSPLIKL